MEQKTSTPAFRYRVPGYLATGLLTITTTLWTFWGFGEMYYEGWWGAWTNRLPYLGPMAICLIFTFITLKWPRFGGLLIFLVGGAFTVWRWIRQAQLGLLTLQWALGWFPLSGILVLAGLLFILMGYLRSQQRAAGWVPSKNWFRRNLGYCIVLAPAMMTALGSTIYFYPLLSSRFDDGDRGARLIKGNGISLIWAPAGPGWSQGIGSSQNAGYLLPGANLSWNEIAFYGISPIGYGEKPGYEDKNATPTDIQLTGLCRYLNASGTTLMAEPQDIWRMPTTEEIVRSLVGGGENAHCTWDGQSGEANCLIQPNKDTPLWNPQASSIYYYSAEEYDERMAWYVPYTGGVRYGGVIGHQVKDGGNSRHGYRCVREP